MMPGHEGWRWIMAYTQLQHELIAAVKAGDEARAEALVARLATQPRKARALLEAMLAAPDALARQAAAFGLGVLGGVASVKRLEKQLALEEARGDDDGASVAEGITRALGRIEEASARASLVRKLERLAAGKLEAGDVDALAGALWKRRHPDLLPAVRQSLERLAPPASQVLQGLLTLLEKTPGELSAWARDPAVPVEQKTEVLAVLDEELPDVLVPALPSFISVASTLADAAVRERGRASSYCDRLFSLLLQHGERVFPGLPQEARSELRQVARRLVASVDLNCSVRAAVILKFVGRPEDAALLEAHRPAEPVLAEVFENAARVLRGS
jgi:hypothetical protein